MTERAIKAIEYLDTYWFYLNILYLSNLQDLCVTAAPLPQLKIKDLSVF